MRNKKIIYIAFLWILVMSSPGYSLQEDTHKAINQHIAQATINNFSLDNYLRLNLGFARGYDEPLHGINANGIEDNKTVLGWLGYGGEQEDRPGDWQDFVLGNPTRSYNHFHNPLKPWSEAGLNDTVFGIPYTGESSVLWAQDSNQIIGGQWSWQTAKSAYYTALIAARTQELREKYFAKTFRAVGQQMHLVHDASVPEHVRNDAHGYGVREAYEGYVDRIRVQQPNLWYAWISNPITFDKTILDISPANTPAPVPISRIIDTDKYVGTNPGITKTDATLPSGQVIGLSEYTNANFLSPGTLFTDDFSPTDQHYFPYPNKENVLHWFDDSNSRGYVVQNGTYSGMDVEPVQHLAVQSLLYGYRMLYFPGQTLIMMPFGLDDKCREEYASKLIPRAVGYSAGLLNYFFRGTLEITAPDRCVYSLIDSAGTQEFTKIKAKVRNTTPDESISSGTLTAVAKYKIRTDYLPDMSNDPPTASSFGTDFSYSVSSSVTLTAADITALNSETPKEFTFEFATSPIPAGITDLYLQVVFKGTLGNEADNAIAVGFKDLSEPTHINLWNTTDYVYRAGQLRAADDPEKITLNERIAFCPTSGWPPQDANDYQVQYMPMEPGKFGRIIFISDPGIQIFYGVTDTPVNDPNPTVVNDWYLPWTTVYQDGIVGDNTHVYEFRGYAFHEASGYFNSAVSVPDAGFWLADWPTAEGDAIPAVNLNW